MTASALRKPLKYLSIAEINSRNNLQYLGNLISRGLAITLRIWVFSQLYRVTYAATHVEQIGGLTVAMVVWSLMFAQSFYSAGRPFPSRIIDEEIKSGAFAYAVNKPYSYPLFHFAGYLGRAVPHTITTVALGTIAALILVGPIPLQPIAIGLGAILLFFGYTLEFLMTFLIGLTAFWIEDTSAFTWIYSKGQMVFGGLILPIALFPTTLQRIAELLPFSQLFYGAARLMVQFDIHLFFRFLAIQLAWIAVFAVLVSILFNKGIKHVSQNGG